MRVLLCFILVISVFADSIEEDPDEYYGVPLGALHYSSSGTSAEVYAADEYTIVFNHFAHHPQESGCTAMMIGPPRSEDTNDVVPGHGVLIGIAQPLMALHKRAKRQFGMWPSSLNMDHLFMDANGENPVKPKKSVFKGIKIHQSDNENVKNITIEPSTTTTTATTTESTTTTATTSKETKTSTTTTTPTTPATSATTTAPSTTSTVAKKLMRRVLKKTTVADTKPLILFDGKDVTTEKPVRNPVTRWSSSESAEGPGIMVMTEQEKHYRKPNQVNPRFRRPLNRNDVTEIQFVTLNPIVSPRRLAADKDDFPRRAPAHNRFIIEQKPGVTAAPVATTPLFWVIPDPHEKRRRERLEELREAGHLRVPPTTTEKPRITPFSPRFALPAITDKAAAFTLTNGAKITDYLWIGLYDQCAHQSVPLVSLKSVDPPREERIAPLSGWSHNVSSYRVQILNCNTVLIPGFTYDGDNSAGAANFYVGIGQFPSKIEKQIKAAVVGQNPDSPLRAYTREDVLIRLPKTYRTFDIDFISIYNPSEDKSYGHIVIPSLLVPPCADD